VADLHEALDSEALRPEAFEIIRGLTDEIVLTPEKGELRIDPRGDFTAILTLSKDSKKLATERRSGLTQIKVVAGACNPFCYNFWPGMALAFRHEIENTHQLAA
jgi:hypothetical protein